MSDPYFVTAGASLNAEQKRSAKTIRRLPGGIVLKRADIPGNRGIRYLTDKAKGIVYVYLDPSETTLSDYEARIDELVAKIENAPNKYRTRPSNEKLLERIDDAKDSRERRVLAEEALFGLNAAETVALAERMLDTGKRGALITWIYDTLVTYITGEISQSEYIEIDPKQVYRASLEQSDTSDTRLVFQMHATPAAQKRVLALFRAFPDLKKDIVSWDRSFYEWISNRVGFVPRELRGVFGSYLISLQNFNAPLPPQDIVHEY